MGAERSVAINKNRALRSAGATERAAWVILAAGAMCFLAVCALAVLGVMELRAVIRVPRNDSSLRAVSNFVSRAHVGEVQFFSVPPSSTVSLRVGETVKIDKDARPGTDAMITLWDGSTIMLYAGARVTLTRLEATLYSSRSKTVELEVDSGQVLVGVAGAGTYQQVIFDVQTPAALVELQSGGNYLLRVQEDSTELSVRSGMAAIMTAKDGARVYVPADSRALARAGQPVQLSSARWSLLKNGDFALGEDYWTFLSNQAGDGGNVEAEWRFEQQQVDNRPTQVLILERTGGQLDRCQAIFYQKVNQDVSAFVSIQLDLQVQIRWQSLGGGGPDGRDYPFNVKVLYHNAEGAQQDYTFGYYDHTGPGYKTEFPERGQTQQIAHYKWEPISLDLLNLPGGVSSIDEIQLFASGNDYRVWIANVSLVAR